MGHACLMKKKIAPIVSLQYVQSMLQASATDTKHTTIFKNKQEPDGHLAVLTGAWEGIIRLKFSHFRRMPWVRWDKDSCNNYCGQKRSHCPLGSRRQRE